jgi:ligand-binding SRPBCC domain-containing protein
MIAGRFTSFEHDHAFAEQSDGSVLVSDDLRFTMPLGWFGDLVGRWILLPHIRGLMKRRFALLKHIAESGEWENYLPKKTLF